MIMEGNILVRVHLIVHIKKRTMSQFKLNLIFFIFGESASLKYIFISWVDQNVQGLFDLQCVS